MESHPLRFLKNLRRTSEIVSVLIQFGFGDLVDRLNLRGYMNWGKKVVTRKESPVNERLTRSQRIRMALESLGPTFIKFGQVASTRPDIIPADVINELASLQEKVPPFPSEQAKEVLEKELGGSLSSLFQEFEMEPIAAGSLGQVHRAVHKDGSLLAIKIRRPNVIAGIESDISLMTEIALLVEKHIPEAEIIDPVGLVNLFARTIRRELDYVREARSMQEFTRLFKKDASLYIPKIYSDLSTDSILTMEFIDGIRLDHVCDHPKLSEKSYELAGNGARIFMKQIFELGVFHGDPHPGNVRYLMDGSFCLLDYGMTGRIDEQTREQLVDLFLCINSRNVAKGVRTVKAIGNITKPVDDTLLEVDFRDFVENYYGVPLEHLDIGKLLSDFVNILAQHRIQCPADLMMLIRAVVSLEGCARILSPKFNLAEELLPFIKRIVRERYQPSRIARKVYEDVAEIAQSAHDFPLQVNNLMKKLEKDEIKVTLEHDNLEKLITEMDRSGNRIAIGMVLSALILASALVIKSDSINLWLGVPLFLGSSLLGIWLIYGIFRSGQV